GMELPETMPLVGWIALHLGGLLAACLSRLTLGGRTDAALQLLTVVAFLSIGAVACMAFLHGGDLLRLWVLSGTTLGAMVVAAVVERSNDSHDPVLMQFVTLDD
ncbi:MAG: hypothetical protein AAGF31_09865, partial [Planctomycetota bacterium]